MKYFIIAIFILLLSWVVQKTSLNYDKGQISAIVE